MKNKITLKLIFYFSASLLLLSVVIGSIFLTLFRSNTLRVHREDMEKRALTIAATLSEYMGGGFEELRPKMGMGGKQGGFGAYLRFIDDIAMANVWIVDENLEFITSGMPGMQYNYADLPEDAEKVVKEALKGRTTFSEGFSDLLKAPTLTVGTPIEYGGQLYGALLLHSPVRGIDQAVSQGISMLITSIVIAFLISILLSVTLVISFTHPLKKMKISAARLAGGDYTAKTGVTQNDEIGDLAITMDILSERLEEARQEGQKLDQLRRDFVANISHELRTPVTVLRGSLEALCDEVVTDPGQVSSFHRQMLNESRILERLVNDLLDLSRLQNADFKMEMQPLNLCEVISDSVRSASHMAGSKGITLSFRPDNTEFTVTGDYGRLRQMLLIILDNAVKFSPAGSEITVLLENGILHIRDQGSGISKADLPYIFDRFYKARSEGNKNGSGLGLAIAKQIADRHNIKIDVKSRINEGTTFSFRFDSMCPVM